MKRSTTFAVCVLLVAAAAACNPQSPTVTSAVTKKPGVSTKAAPSPGGGAVVQPGQSFSPSALPTGGVTPAPAATATGAPSTGPGPTPTLFRPTPNPEPTPLPSGYVSPLPPNAFPTPESTPRPTATPLPTPTPVATPTPVPQDGAVLSNTIPDGIGEVTGYVAMPIANKPGEYVAASGVSILISNQLDATQKAKLTNAGNGTFRLSAVPLGEYYVRVEKAGYASDSAPTPVRIYPGSTSRHVIFLVVPEN
jgi:hypothetical protein